MSASVGELLRIDNNTDRPNTGRLPQDKEPRKRLRGGCEGWLEAKINL